MSAKKGGMMNLTFRFFFFTSRRIDIPASTAIALGGQLSVRRHSKEDGGIHQETVLGEVQAGSHG